MVEPMERPRVAPCPCAGEARDEPIRAPRAVVRPASLARRHLVDRAHRPVRPVRPPGAGGAQRRRVHPRRSRVGPGEGAAPDRDRGCPGGRRGRVPLGRDARRRARVRGRRRVRDRGRPRRLVRANGPVAYVLHAPGLARRAHRLRHRAPRSLCGRLAAGPAGPACGAPRRPRAGGRPLGRTRVLRGRAGRVRGGPPQERADLAPARRPRAPAGVRVRRGVGGAADRRGCGGRDCARGDLRRRRPHADEHLRAESRHPPRPGPGRGLLAAHHEPLSGGAVGARLAGRRRGGCRRGHRSNRRAGRCSSPG